MWSQTDGNHPAGGLFLHYPLYTTLTIWLEKFVYSKKFPAMFWLWGLSPPPLYCCNVISLGNSLAVQKGGTATPVKTKQHHSMHNKGHFLQNCISWQMQKTFDGFPHSSCIIQNCWHGKKNRIFSSWFNVEILSVNLTAVATWEAFSNYLALATFSDYHFAMMFELLLSTSHCTLFPQMILESSTPQTCSQRLLKTIKHLDLKRKVFVNTE